MRVIECVPNVSEGRRPEVVAAVAEAIRASGAHLLDTTADASHHRAVYTFAGSPAEASAGARAVFAAALPLIDLRTHIGVHPRIGAVDVVPFVPLGDATMDDAVAVARSTAEIVAAEFALPVYLYEHAAVRPERRRLEQIRRSGFEAAPPDFGPARPHPSAGAAVIGARWPLVAWNINLATNRLEIARRIASSIRESSGGFPAVKALGLALAARGIVQVSMNLTDYRRTSMLEVFDAVTARATEEGVGILESELIGLVPEAALPPSPETELLLRHYRVLEHVLGEHGLI